MRLLSEEQAQEIFKSEHCNISKDLAGILYRAIEAAVLEAQGKQEPVAFGWRDVAEELPTEAQEVLFVRGDKVVHGAWIGGIFWHSNTKMAAAKWMPLPPVDLPPLYAAPVVQPQQEPVGKPHRWNDDGERCLDCGDKDWMADKYCSAAPVVQEKQKPSDADRSEAYGLIDRQLRNTLDDSEYADYSAALDLIYAAPVVQPDRRRLHNDIAEVVAKQLHYFDNVEKINGATTAKEVSDVLEGGIDRYRNDAVFHAKVCSLVAHLTQVIAAAEGKSNAVGKPTPD